jgi:hypothetical protein
MENGLVVAVILVPMVATMTSEEETRGQENPPKCQSARKICKSRTNAVTKRERASRNCRFTPSFITPASIHRSHPIAASCLRSRSADHRNIRFPLGNDARPENKKTAPLP